MSVFYERLEELCAREHLMVCAAVKIMGFSTGNIAHWKNGTVPKGKVLQKVAQFFHVTVDSLVEHSESPLPEQQQELLRKFALLSQAQRSELLRVLDNLLK